MGEPNTWRHNGREEHSLKSTMLMLSWSAGLVAGTIAIWLAIQSAVDVKVATAMDIVQGKVDVRLLTIQSDIREVKGMLYALDPSLYSVKMRKRVQQWQETPQLSGIED